MITLDKVTEALQTGKRPKGGAVTSGVPSLGAEHLNASGGFKLSKLKYVGEEFFMQMKSGIIQENDIIIVKDGATTGKVSYVDHTFPIKVACTNEHVFILRLKEQALSKYVFYHLFGPIGQRQILEDFRGATVGGISKGFTKNVKIPLPPLDQQKKIAAILDEADAYRQKTKALIEKYDELTQSLFLDMFGDPVSNPKGWDKKVASEYYEVRGRVGWKGYKKTDLRQEGAIVLGATHVTKSGEIDLEKVVYLSDEKYIESPEIMVKLHDLIFVQRGNTIGKVALVRKELGETTINPVVLIFRPIKANPFFLLYLLMNKKQNREFVNSNSGSAQPMITQKTMKEFLLINVPLNEQDKFGVRILSIEAQKAQVQASLTQAEDLFNSLLQKAFKGELL
jgi:type I restriction enzyme S subunit